MHLKGVKNSRIKADCDEQVVFYRYLGRIESRVKTKGMKKDAGNSGSNNGCYCSCYSGDSGSHFISEKEYI